MRNLSVFYHLNLENEANKTLAVGRAKSRVPEAQRSFGEKENK